ncbi:MAG: RDD family protein [Aureliella sp.]
MTSLTEAKIDCRTRVVTPENIAFEYALAGPFQRLPAFLLDWILRAGFFLAFVIFVSMVSAFAPLGGGTFFLIVAILLFFFLSWFYGVIFETRFNGRTLGKMAFKLRVISADGRPINASQAALRNLLRGADLCILLPIQIFGGDGAPWFVIPTATFGMTAMVLNSRFQRIGDLVAGTMVISERSASRPWRQKPDDVRAYGLADKIPANFVASSSLVKTLGLYMENRKRLSPGRLDELATHIAGPLIRKFELLPDTGPDLLLVALYARVFLSDSEREAGLKEYRNIAGAQRNPNMRAAGIEPPSGTQPAVGHAEASGQGVEPGELQQASLGDMLSDKSKSDTVEARRERPDTPE